MAHPTLVLCPGAWHTSECYSLIAPKLMEAGHKVILLDWPSIIRSEEVRSGDDDIAHLASILSAEADLGNDIAVVAHSWSGAPVNSTVKEFTRREREGQGKKGGVVKLIFIAAFVVPVGVSIFDVLGGKVPDLWDVQGDIVYAKDPGGAFYNDLPEDEQKHWVSKLRGHAIAVKYAKTRGAAYLLIPSWYLQCENDKAMPVVAQASMVKQARDQGADMKTEIIKSGHSPFLSSVDETAKFIVRAATS